MLQAILDFNEVGEVVDVFIKCNSESDQLLITLAVRQLTEGRECAYVFIARGGLTRLNPGDSRIAA